MPTTPIPFVYPVSSVRRIHDGDTFTATLDLGFNTFREVVVRLAGLDTPEVTGASKPAGLAVLHWAANRIIESKDLTLESREVDKYGRSLGVLYLNGVSLNKQLIDKGMALAYDGRNRAGTWTAAKLAAAFAAAEAASSDKDYFAKLKA
jgi:micrococcal nuclease